MKASACANRDFPGYSMSSTHFQFQSVEEALAECSDMRRHMSPISSMELRSLGLLVENMEASSPCSRSGLTVLHRSEEFELRTMNDALSGLPRTLTTYKIRGVAPQVLFHCVNSPMHRLRFDASLKRFEVLRQDNSLVDVILTEISTPVGISNREFVEWRRIYIPQSSEPRSKREYICHMRSCSDEILPPNGKRVQRGETWLSGYVFKWWLDENNACIGTQIKIISQVDPKGNMPKALPKALVVNHATKWVKRLIDYSRKFVSDMGLNMSMSDSEIDQALHLIPVESRLHK